jgi:hypothetical protein
MAVAAAFSSAASAEWYAYGSTAVAIDKPVQVAVAFDSRDDCDSAILWIDGNTEITSIMLIVDDKVFDPATPSTLTDNGVRSGVYVDLLSTGIRALKNGSKAALMTDQGTVLFSLAGSSRAMSAAYDNCMGVVAEKYAEILKPLQPSAPQDQPKIEVSPWEPSKMNSRELGM